MTNKLEFNLLVMFISEYLFRKGPTEYIAMARSFRLSFECPFSLRE